MQDEHALHADLNSICATTNGRIGIYAQHLPSNYRYCQHENESFFMASVFKIPIAIHCLQLAEQDKLRLTDIIELQPTDIRPYGILDRHFQYPGVSLSIYNLLQIMLQLSDNTATDLLLKLTGGPTAVMNSLNHSALQEINITHNCLQLLLKQAGVEYSPTYETATLASIKKLLDTVPKEIAEKANNAFHENPPNSATPKSIGELLIQIQQGSLLSKESTDLLIHWMRGCKIGLNRIRALLPANTLVADKTGSMTGITNDVAIIELPQNKGQLILVVFIKHSTKTKAHDEQVIARIARTLFDYVQFKIN